MSATEFFTRLLTGDLRPGDYCDLPGGVCILFTGENLEVSQNGTVIVLTPAAK